MPMTFLFERLEGIFGPDGPPVIAEIGAADGRDTLGYADRYPKAIIHAFEPLESNLVLLRRIEAVCGKIHVHPGALGGAEGEVSLWVSGGSPPDGRYPGEWPYSSSLFAPTGHTHVHPWCTFTERTTKMRRFDSLRLVPPDYIHIDVQGAELGVLSGFGTQLAAVTAVWMEVSTIELYKRQPLYHDVLRFMDERGFNLAVDTAKGQIQGDQLWVR